MDKKKIKVKAKVRVLGGSPQNHRVRKSVAKGKSGKNMEAPAKAKAAKPAVKKPVKAAKTIGKKVSISAPVSVSAKKSASRSGKKNISTGTVADNLNTTAPTPTAEQIHAALVQAEVDMYQEIRQRVMVMTNPWHPQYRTVQG